MGGWCDLYQVLFFIFGFFLTLQSKVDDLFSERFSVPLIGVMMKMWKLSHADL